jgi:aryl-alcohol dehydrogenase-like predicted oxidoreductase
MQALVLGTAQWGNAYGVTNSVGRLTDQQIAEIAEVALEAGIRFADTAAGYGDAEARLAPWAKNFAITTKVKGAGSTPIPTQISQSFGRLGVDEVRCGLIHDWASLTDEEANDAAKALKEAKAQGKIEKIGISAYDEHDLKRALAIFGIVDAVQVPVSILDRRLIGSDSIDALVAQGCEIQARSVFLQGLLAARSDSKLGQHPDVREFHEVCEKSDLNPIQEALSFVGELVWVSQVIVGFTSALELNEILRLQTDPSGEERTKFHGSQDPNLIDPRNWSV